MKAAVARNRAFRAQSMGIVAASAATMTPDERTGAAPPTPTRDRRRPRRDLPDVPPALPPPRGHRCGLLRAAGGPRRLWLLRALQRFDRAGKHGPDAGPERVRALAHRAGCGQRH